MKLETARVASARRTAWAATASAKGLISRRAGEPYSRENVRQSPCTSTITGTRRRASARPASAAAPRKGSDAKIACGRKLRIWRRSRSGSRR